MMTKLTLPLLTATLAAFPLFAMGAGVESLDANADGMLSFIEVQAGYPDLTEEAFTVMDANDDGLLDAEEVAAAQEAGTMPMPNEG